MCKYSSYFHLLWDLLCKSFLQIGYFCKSHITIYSHLQNIIQCKSHKTNHLVSPFKLFPWCVKHWFRFDSGLTIFPPFQSVAEFKNLNCKCCSTHSTLAPLSTFGRIQLQVFLLWSDPVIIGSVNFNLQIQWAVILQISEPCMNAYLCRPHTFSDL